jgi:phosphate transport system permease protein
VNTFRRAEEKAFMFLSLIAALIATFMLFWIIGSIFIGGIESLTWYFLTTAESETPHIGMGILNAVVGTIVLSTCATIFALPFAFCTAIYLTRYAKDTWCVRALRFFIEVLSGTPSIVLGMFGFLVFVYYLKYFTGGFSLLAGSIALSILIMPVIERATEDAINTVGSDLEEGSYALGSTKWQTIRGITIPVAMSGIMTGAILGFGRAAEESAVVILTAGYTQYMPYMAVKSNPDLMFGAKFYPFQHVIASLPYSVYHAYENSNVIPLSNGFAAAFVLICVVLVINILAKTILWYCTKGKKRSSGSILSSLRKAVFRDSTRPSPPGTVLPAACAAAEIASASRESVILVPEKRIGYTSDSSASSSPTDWTSALTQPVQPSSPVPSIDSGENPHILSFGHHDPDMPWDGSILPDDTRELPVEMDLPSGTITDSRGAGFEAVPLPELFEDKPPAILESRRVRVPGFGGEYEPDVLLAEPGDDLLLMEEPPLTAQPKPTAHPYENWPLMAKNQWENTDV